MSNNNQKDIFSINVDVEPSAVEYRLSTKEIENFLGKFLAAANIDGIGTVKLKTEKAQGDARRYTNYVIRPVVFVSASSSDVSSTIDRSIANVLKDKLGSNQYRLSDKLAKILGPLCGFNFDVKILNNNWLGIELDIFAVLASVFNCGRSFHINIAAIEPHSADESSISVIKVKRFETAADANKTDTFTHLLNKI